MIANPNPPDPSTASGQVFFALPAYPKLATVYSEEITLTDPYCQAFIEAMAAILVHLSQQRKPSHAQKPHQAQRQER